MRQLETIWVVVEVSSGVPVDVEAFREEKRAQQRAKSLRRRIHPENDNVVVFETGLLPEMRPCLHA